MPHIAAPYRSPHYPTRGQALRPFTRANRYHRRLSRRIAGGLTPAQAARAEGAPEAEVARLVADPAFADLVAAYREIQDEPEDRARESLRRFARTLLEDALIEGDVGAAMFILREEARGRDPADTLARGVVATFRRQSSAAAEPPPAPPPAPEAAPPRPPREPADRACWDVAARLRGTLLDEAAIIRQASAPSSGEPRPATVGPVAASPTPALALEPAKPSRPARPAPNRRERRRLAALRRRAPPTPGAVPPADRPRGRPPP